MPHTGHQPYSMAYPFPRLASAPQTPKYESNSPSMPHPPSHTSAWKRTGLVSLTIIALLVWTFSRLPHSAIKPNKMSSLSQPPEDFFSHFQGHGDCSVTSRDLYVPPRPAGNTPKHSVYCRNRKRLLEAMSEGGRHGFEQPYFPVGCHYRWYSIPEICMILERFDALVFIGDDILKHIYGAFNILLKEDMATGALDLRHLDNNERPTCTCDNQFIKSECSKAITRDSQAIGDHDRAFGKSSPYHCNRTPHMFIPISGSPATEELHSKFTSVLSQDPDAYKPIPVVHGVSLSTSFSLAAATSSMDEWVSIADDSGRNVPFLWVGPNAAGHLKSPSQVASEGNNAVWHYTLDTAREAKSRQLDTVGMYNLTLQANSWDGSNYGLRIGLVQAMMVINWLSRVEST